jgi:hypothetical protein
MRISFTWWQKPKITQIEEYFDVARSQVPLAGNKRQGTKQGKWLFT